MMLNFSQGTTSFFVFVFVLGSSINKNVPTARAPAGCFKGKVPNQRRSATDISFEKMLGFTMFYPTIVIENH